MGNRILSWEGCKNVRDLGGLRTTDGRITRFGQIVRSDTPSLLTDAGWAALYDFGVRTIVTLRTHGMQESELDFTSPYPDIETIQIPIEDVTDEDFVKRWALTELWGTPLYYQDALQRWPERHAAALSAIAQAQPGAVLFHCIRGHDRTGIITLLLLNLIGTEPDEILADYELSVDPERDELLKKHKISGREVLLGTLDSLDVHRYLLKGGASEADLAAIRQRLLG
ncbi:MAG: tyrosine-protein phosphatase [Anaerolineales bacterium]|jgi:protein tyrosine/serine phosphatase